MDIKFFDAEKLDFNSNIKNKNYFRSFDGFVYSYVPDYEETFDALKAYSKTIKE